MKRSYREAIIRRPIFIGLVFAACILPALAQSPTDTFIRLHFQKESVGPTQAAHLYRPEVKIQRSNLTRTASPSAKQEIVHSRVRVVTKTEREAQKAARRTAYLAAVSYVTPSGGTEEIKVLRRKLGVAVADLRSATAQVISSRKVAQGYEAEAEVTRPVKALQADFRAVGISNNRVLIFFQDGLTTAFAGSPAANAEEALEGALTDKGFTVLDRKYLAGKSAARALITSESKSLADAVTQESLASLCGIVVLGTVDVKPSQNTEGIISATANLGLRVLSGESGQVIATRRYTEKGFGMSVAQAGEAALDKLTKTASEDLPNAIQASLQIRQTTIVLDDAGAEAVTGIETALRKMSGVKQVNRVADGGQTRLVVLTTEKPAFLGINLSQYAGVESVDFGVGIPTKEKP